MRTNLFYSADYYSDLPETAARRRSACQLRSPRSQWMAAGAERLLSPRIRWLQSPGPRFTFAGAFRNDSEVRRPAAPAARTAGASAPCGAILAGADGMSRRWRALSEAAAPRQQLSDAADQVPGYALEDGAQVSLWIEDVEPRRRNERRHPCGANSAGVRARQQQVFLA